MENLHKITNIKERGERERERQRDREREGRNTHTSIT